MRSSLIALLLLVVAPVAFGAEFTITYTGTVSSASGDLAGVLSGGEVISGSLTLETTTPGSFTPSPNPMWLRSEMLYTGAVTAAAFSMIGDTVSGVGGDAELFDSNDGMFAGEDSYEVTAVLDTGTIGGFAPASIFFNPSYDYDNYTLSSGDPLFPPAPFADGNFKQFSLVSASGGTAYGAITGFEVATATTVPALPAWALILLSAAFVRAGARRAQARG